MKTTSPKTSPKTTSEANPQVEGVEGAPAPGGARGEAPDKKKSVKKYDAIAADDPAWRILKEVRAESHEHLKDAVFALVWERRVRADKDGKLVLGRAKKTSKLEREFRPHDFTILLNYAVWAALPEGPRRALMDHELSHCAKGENAKGETVYRMRKHDLEEFEDVVRRHGLWRSGVERFVDAALDRGQSELFPDDGARQRAVAVILEHAKKKTREAWDETAGGDLEPDA